MQFLKHLLYIPLHLQIFSVYIWERFYKVNSELEAGLISALFPAAVWSILP